MQHMATAADRKRCAICNKEKATLRCGGCSKDFCFTHVADHRQELSKQLDEVEVTRDLFRQALTEQSSQPQKHPLVQQIDKWERESINKIRQTAEEARQLIFQHTAGQITDTEVQLNKLTDQLRQSRQEDDFFETDLSRWKKELARLTEALKTSSNINIRQNSVPLVTKITVDVQNNEESTLKTGHQKIGQYFKPEEKRDTVRANTTDQTPNRHRMDVESEYNRAMPKTTGQSISDDEDNENDPTQRRSGAITRSLASLPKLRINFADSDDDDNESYSSWAQKDMEDYRSGYPNARSDSRITDNYDFYTNKIPSHPDGDTIDNIHKKWFGDYRKLELHNGYIEWLFPLQEKGLNLSAERLQKHEIEKIKNDKKALERILKSYELMLDFYGFELANKETGEIRRLRGNAYKERFRNLNTSSHNYLRITRILKCLGEFDYEHLKLPFLEAILRESITENTLANCLQSCQDCWIETLYSTAERRAIRQYARELLEYRNKGITPPKAHRANRPPPRSTTTAKTGNISLSKSNDNEYHSS